MTRIITTLLTAILISFFSVEGQNLKEAIKKTAPDREGNDNFGKAVAISGDYAIAGAEGEDHDLSGGNTLNNSGAAYILKKDVSGNWTVVQKIVASDREVNAYFGCSVAMLGDYAIVGAIGESQDASGGSAMSSAGAVYIFKNNSGTWTQIQKIVHSDRAANDYFGKSLAISGDFLVVGATGEDHNVAGGSTFESAGSVYIFKNISGTWSQIQKVVASDRAGSDYFGAAVAIEGDFIVAGAFSEDEDISGGNTKFGSGSAYIYKNTAGTWSQVQKIVASDRLVTPGDDYFGISVSISGNYLIVGAKWNEEGTFYDTGAAYIFRNIAGTWTEVQKIVASDRFNSDHFGQSVSISGDYAIIGAPDEDEDPSGGNTLTSSGSAYVYKNNSGTWNLIQKIVSSDRGTYEYFGNSVSISGDFTIAGAYGDFQDASGNNPLGYAGSVFIFSKAIPAVTNQPVNQTNICGETNVSFSVSGNYITNYKWQLSSDGGNSFSDISDGSPYSNSGTNTLNVLSGAGLNNYRFRCKVLNANSSDTSETALLTIENTNPVVNCVANQVRNIPDGQTLYVTQGTEFDPVSVSDNCGLAELKNNFNNTSSLAGAEFPVGSTTVIWTAKDKSGNSSFGSFTIKISTPTGINEVTDNDILIYPNPADGNITITSENSRIISVTIMEFSGKKLISKEGNQNSCYIDISGLPHGVFIVKVKTVNKNFLSKIIRK